MAEFQYIGVDRQGKRVTGKVEAPSEGELRMILRGQGVRPTRIGKVGILQQDLGSIFRGGSFGRISTTSLAVFTRQLQVLISSGIPLVQALEVLTEQAPDPAIKKIFTAVKEKVSQGAFLWESLAGYGKAFPRVYVALVRAAESSGAMDLVLDRLAKYLESTAKLQKTVKAAMMYPAIVVLVGISVISGMIVFVIPKFESLLRSSNQELPAITRWLIDTSHYVTNHIQFFIGGAITFAYLSRKYIQSPEGKNVVDRIFYVLPVLGEILVKAGVARFSRTLGTLLGAGVNLIEALDVCKTTIDNAVLEESVVKVRREVESGKSLASILTQVRVFPRMAVQMIGIGESTGNMEKMLNKVADIYESDVETMVAGLSKLIEPIMIVILGGCVGFVLIAMYLPIFKLPG